MKNKMQPDQVNKIPDISYASPIHDSSKKKRTRSISNQSTPVSQRLVFNSSRMLNMKQTTNMKRRKKRDPTICRKGIEQMDPYLIIKDESEMLKAPNQLSLAALTQPQYSKLVEKWCRFEYFYSSVDR